MNKFKILLVDDLQNNLYILELLIYEYFDDVEIIQKLSAKEALEIVLKVDVDLIFSDVQMPDMDGFEFTKILKSYKKTLHIPIILITALSLERGHQIKGFEVGAVDYITKPIDREILIPKIKNFKKIFELQKQTLKQNEEIKILAYYDTLTGLANRKTISKRIDEEIHFSLRNGTISALIFLDLDGFKHINDSLGHDCGDKVLQLIAKKLENSIRDFDIAGRIGGDEFIVLIRGNEKDPGISKEQFSVLLNRILENINEPFEVDGMPLHVGASLGVALMPQDGEDSNTIIKHADNAMYKAKNSGKNRAVFYDSRLQTEADKLLFLRSELIQAVKNGEFMMYYQAQYDLKGENILAYEALIRWQHPSKGIIYPSEFIPYLEQFNLSFMIDKYVFEKVCTDLKNNVNVSINLSAKSFENNEFVQFLKKIIKKYKLDTSKITLEVTEASLIKNIDNSFLKDIKDLGFKISIDDFGTGYSSLSYISSMKFDEIKLDMAFVQAISKSKRDADICKFILHMFRDLDVNIVAEGVETQEQLAFVSKEGANVIQGYIYSKPQALPLK